MVSRAAQEPEQLVIELRIQLLLVELKIQRGKILPSHLQAADLELRRHLELNLRVRQVRRLGSAVIKCRPFSSRLEISEILLEIQPATEKRRAHIFALFGLHF